MLDRNYILAFDATVLDDVVEKVGAKKWLPTITPPTTSLDGGDDENYSINGDAESKLKSKSAPPSAFRSSLDEISHANTM